ncbi:MAG: type II toxin-antitoxin system PemK/MazF family toxin, partial [Hyphomonadaceae bacterium]|nr:type II toxin-antitoxin system PemK/MazF family toxin [Clostridia bacterium]
VGEVWWAEFPYEETSDFKKRPVIVLDADTIMVLSVKVTTSNPRDNDIYDVPILYWSECKLRLQSTARTAKTILIAKSAFKHKIGDMHEDDLNAIFDTYVQYLEDNGIL